MPIVRSGYATQTRNGSTRQWRNTRAHILALAATCGICGEAERKDDPFEVGHITPHAYGGTNHISNLQAQHRSCNRRLGAMPTPTTQGGGGHTA